MQHDTEQARNPGAQAQDSPKSAKDAAARVGDEVKQEAREQAENIRSQAEAFAEQQRHDAGSTVAALGAALHAGQRSLESDGHPSMADYWRSAAVSIDQLADRVQNKSAGEILSEAERYVREQPGLGFGGAMVAGFMLARFLKSSSPESSTSESGYHAADSGYGRAGSDDRVTEPDYPTPDTGYPPPTYGGGSVTASPAPLPSDREGVKP